MEHELAGREKALKRDSGHWSETEFWDHLEPLSDDMLEPTAYEDAVGMGHDALPDDAKTPDAAKTVKEWIDHVRPYAQAVPKRLAGEIADTLLDVDDGSTAVDEILSRLDQKLANLRQAVTRYADPPWGAGQQGYGEGLDANEVLLVWELDDAAEHCEDCPRLAAGSPYGRGTIPAWPCDGSTACLDHCRCTITADPASWAAAFPAA